MHVVDLLVQYVSEESGVPVDLLISDKRSRRVSFARDAVTVVAKASGCSLAEIAHRLHQHHPSAMEALERAYRRLETVDEEFTALVSHLHMRLENGR